MCGLCGVLGGVHWTEGAGRLNPGTRRAERLRQVALANAVLAQSRLKLSDWQGTNFVLAGPTGAQEVVDSLPAAWDAAARMLGRRLDPLDPALLAHLRSGQK